MYLKNISIKNFKNLDCHIEFSDKINLIIAPNGSGKTNLLETIYLLGHGSSFRNYPEVNLINFQNNFAKINGETDSNKLEILISRFGENSQKYLKINEKIRKNSTFTKYLNSILFSPNTIDLVDGTPDIRRKDLDDFISTFDIVYSKKIGIYKKVIKNRNKILLKLKNSMGSLEELDFWNDKLITLGGQLVSSRLTFLSSIRKYLDTTAKMLLEKKESTLKINYYSKIIYDDKEPSKALKKKILSNLDKEIMAEASLYGPHRDDIEFIIDEKNLKLTGSRAQQRLAVLIYKIASWKYLENILQIRPLFLLDDVMSELDNIHRHNLENYLLHKLHTQVLITSSEKTIFSKNFIDRTNLIELNKINKKYSYT